MNSIKDNDHAPAAYKFIVGGAYDTKSVFKDYLNDGYRLVDEKQRQIDEKLELVFFARNLIFHFSILQQKHKNYIIKDFS